MQYENQFPQTLHDAVKYFAKGDNAFNFMVSLRWPNGVCCPRCESKNIGFIATRKMWECRDCTTKKQFTVKVGTIMEDSAVKLDKWLCAIWMVSNCKNGISSYEMHRSLGVTQKTAWFMMHRIRLALQNGTIVKMGGEVEVDETYIGGKARNMHKGKRKVKGPGAIGKTAVQGLLQRHGAGSKIVVKVLKDTKIPTLQANVKEYVLKGANVYTDALTAYQGLNAEYAHEFVDHAECYVKGKVHTNGLENFWSLLKRGIRGTYVSVEPFHLFRYLDEQAFRFNERKDNDAGRFVKAISGIIGKNLTFAKLTGKDGCGELLPA